MKKIQAAKVKNKKVLVRVDFNVPIVNGKIQEEFRIKAVIPTIEYLLKNQVKKIILVSHLGRPEGKIVKNLSLKPIGEKLAKILGSKDSRIKDTRIKGFEGFQISSKIYLLENIRFFPEEEKSDPKFAKKLAKMADIFIFDGFGVAHHDSASVSGIAKILPSAVGLLVQKELKNLNFLLKEPQKPFVAVLGGAKTEDKLPVIKNLFGKVQTFIIGGGIANTFLAAKEIPVGNSVYADNLKGEANEIMKMILDDPVRDIFIPQDFVVSKSKTKPVKVREVSRGKIKKDDIIVDIGSKTMKMIEPKIRKAATIFWNGTFGIAEIDEFNFSTHQLAKMIVKSQAKSIAAGGDTVAAINRFGLLAGYDFVSTGGGATLEYLAGKRLPGLEILT